MLNRGPNWDSAIKQFWAIRQGQSLEQQIRGDVQDSGSRSSVTGGKHLQPLADAIVSCFRMNPNIGSRLKIYSGANNYLPGWYRESKNWDIVVTYQGALVAVIELKSQVGSLGNNFNNRVEEAIGNAADLWRANEYDELGQIKPWTAFIMVIEDTIKSRSPVASKAVLPPFETDPVFRGQSRIDRYRIALKRLVSEGQYDTAVVIATSPNSGISLESEPMLSLANLEAAIKGRLAYIEALPSTAFAPLDRTNNENQQYGF